VSVGELQLPAPFTFYVRKQLDCFSAS